MKKYLAMLIGAVGMMAAGLATTGCWIIIIDEPEMPKSMLNKKLIKKNLLLSLMTKDFFIFLKFN